jgi:tetratricopeptide (TPR) repeat protein
MEKSKYIEQIDAYIEDSLPPSDKQALETALSQDAQLQEALRWHKLMDRTLAQAAEDAEIRQAAHLVRLRLGKLPTPKPELNLWQKLLKWLRTPFGLSSVLVPAAFIGLLIYASTLASVLELTQNFAIAPIKPNQAGNAPETTKPSVVDEQFVLDIAKVYADNTPEETLKKLSILRGGTQSPIQQTVVDFYEAYAHFANKDYEAALPLFDKALSGTTVLKEFSLTNSLSELRFNRLLADLAVQKDESKTLAALDKLLADTTTKGKVREKALALKTALSHPLRSLRF